MNFHLPNSASINPTLAYKAQKLSIESYLYIGRTAKSLERITHSFSGNYSVYHTLGKLLDSDWLRDCEFIRNLGVNSVFQGKLQISRAKICNSF